MSETNKSILSHVSIGTNDFARAAAFYDRVMPALGCRRMAEHPGAVAYGKEYPEFWVQVPIETQSDILAVGWPVLGVITPGGCRWA